MCDWGRWTMCEGMQMPTVKGYRWLKFKRFLPLNLVVICLQYQGTPPESYVLSKQPLVSPLHFTLRTYQLEEKVV